jgi:hypothetical protein
MKILRSAILFGASCTFVAACGGDDDEAVTTDDTVSSLQTPPQGEQALETWLRAGHYKKWHCEGEVHESRSPSPHGFNRICSNDAIAEDAAGDSDWAKGAAAVKELYASADAADPMGYSVYLKTAHESAGGDHWYWYERFDAAGLVADGLGTSGAAKTICVACHIAAGSDTAHTPTAGGRDQVYTPVP